MITKKVSFAFVVLSFGLFLTKCGDVIPSYEDAGSISLPENPSSSSSQLAEESPPPKNFESYSTTLKAEPVAASTPDNPKVLASWIGEAKNNIYLIDVGYIGNSLIMQTNHKLYLGYGELTTSMGEEVENSMSRSRAETVSNSVVVSNGSTDTESLETATTAGVTSGVTTGVDKTFKVEASLETSLETSTSIGREISRTINIERGRATETSESIITSLKRAVTNLTSYLIGREDPIGYYRYAWYATSDVYFIITTTPDNQKILSWEVISCPREINLEALEYSPDGKFDNSPKAGDSIVFAKDFYKKLPIPTTVTPQQYTLTTKATEGGTVSKNLNQTTYNAGTQITVTATSKDGYVFNNWTNAPSGVNASSPSITFAINSNITLTANFRKLAKKSYTKYFSTAGDATYTFNHGLFTEVEIIAYGACGGGQGGHKYSEKFKDYKGTGGAGGAGAGAYVKFKVDKSCTINMSIGNGGIGGDGVKDFLGFGYNGAGYSGKDGEATTVTLCGNKIGNNNLNVEGGKGALGEGEHRKNLHGGSGGRIINWPKAIDIIESDDISGYDGGNGEKTKDIGNKGGKFGRLDSFGGEVCAGAGGYGNNKGGDGSDGKVIMIITYYE